MVKITAWFNVTAVTNNSGNCLPHLLLFYLNYCVVVATYSILVYDVYAKIEYVTVRTYPSKVEHVRYVSSSFAAL